MPFNGGGGGGGGGSGTVTSFAFTNGAGVTGSVSSPTVSPNLSLAFATQTPGNNTTNVATTAFVTAGLALKANLASPTFTGTPVLPTGTTGVTQTLGDNTTKLATTAFVIANAGAGITALTGDVTASGSGSVAATVAKIAGVAVGTPTGTGNVVFNSGPAFAGVPTAPTATLGTNTTQIATTAFVIANAGTPSVSAYSALANSTGSTTSASSVQYMTLGTPGFTPAANTSAIQITTTIASYFQAVLQNLSTNKANSTDFVATADDGDDSTHYADFGINGSQSGAGSATPPFTTAHAAYLYTVDNELDLAATGASGVINFYTTGGTSPVLAGSISASQNWTMTGTQTATAQISSGLTGATGASRYVGGTASGAPASGTFVIGDFIVDRTGSFWICTTAGSPGTWTQLSAGGYSLPTASTTVLGGVKIDGTSITISAGVISAGAGAAAFSSLTGGTNTTAAMVVGTGASLAASGSGTIAATSCTGNAATVTTNANLTGPITSSGNATSIAAQTGTGTTFVMSAGPTLTGTLTCATVTASGQISTSVSGTASTPALTMTGAAVTGSTSTSFPLFYIAPSGVSAATVNVNGTYFGVNCASGFTGIAMAVYNNGGAATFTVSPAGNISSLAVACSTCSPTGAYSGSKAGAASTSAMSLTGTVLTGGSGTTNFPHFRIEPSAGTSAITNWSTSGTAIGVNLISAFAGNFIDCRASGSTSIFQVTSGGALTIFGKMASYNGIATVGWGTPAVYGQARSTAQTAAVASVAAYTVGGADGSFEVSANINVTASTTASFTMTVTYTDETNTSRTATFSFVQAGVPTPIQTITNVTGVGAYAGMPLYIRCKASTAITIATTGTFTSVTYNAEGAITQAA